MSEDGCSEKRRKSKDEFDMEQFDDLNSREKERDMVEVERRGRCRRSFEEEKKKPDNLLPGAQDSELTDVQYVGCI